MMLTLDFTLQSFLNNVIQIVHIQEIFKELWAKLRDLHLIIFIQGSIDQIQLSKKLNRASYVDDGTYLWGPQHHYKATKQFYSRDQLCHFTLRLTKNQANSKGSLTVKQKQQIAYGFETEFTVQILHPSKECVSTICRENYAHGFSVILHNLGPTIDSSSVTYAEGLGYTGLNEGLVIEFDFKTNLNLNDPTYPHLSIQYNQYAAQFMYSSSADWMQKYKIGLLQIYVDDMEFPALSAPINIAKCVQLDDHNSLKQSIGKQQIQHTRGGRPYLSWKRIYFNNFNY
ncbi:UNKNOWN [Stylonychia lemnae]|uniref:Uncharacterized protein n=1 Tax=Stylonychia lemnae TaxID=5949 RepID=A0A078ALQ0_STYLE|nr:UNKNOWN [Stylonychia lemnae]|eukprot:CDW82801.1 UNKNOWN [Stylonychia lemnae]